MAKVRSQVKYLRILQNVLKHPLCQVAKIILSGTIFDDNFNKCGSVAEFPEADSAGRTPSSIDHLTHGRHHALHG